MNDEEFERLAEHFREDTGMLAPGKNEAPAAIGQTNFSRREVRNLLWDLWLSARRRFEELRATYAGTLGGAMNLEGEVKRLRAVVDKAPKDPETLAMAFHEAYERLAPKFGYETRKETRTAWRQLPGPNQELMLAVAQEIIDGYYSTPEAAQQEKTP